MSVCRLKSYFVRCEKILRVFAVRGQSDEVLYTYAISSSSLSYAGHTATVTDMFLEADDALFRKILYNKAHRFFTRTFLRGQILSTHNKALICSGLSDRILVRALCKDCYRLFFAVYYHVFFICMLLTNFLISLHLLSQLRVTICIVKET